MDRKISKNIVQIKNEIEDLLVSIDDLEINIIQSNVKNTQLLELYRLMMENIILEHHSICKKIFSK